MDDVSHSDQHTAREKSVQSDSTSDSAIDILPPEILINIFLETVPSIDEMPHNHARPDKMVFQPYMSSLAINHRDFLIPLIIASVSKEWRLMALGCPSLWATLSMRFYDAEMPLPVLREWLERSKAAPLTIIMQGDKGRMKNNVEDSCDTIRTLFEVADRWKYFFILSNWGTAAEERQLEDDEYDTLSNRLRPSSYTSNPATAFSAPLLEAVCVHFGAEADSLSFLWLSTFFDLLQAIVASAPKLRSLHWEQEDVYGDDEPVQVFCPVGGSQPQPPSLSAHCWTNLRNVYLHRIEVEAGASLLIAAPRLESANFGFVYSPDNVSFRHGWQSRTLDMFSLSTIKTPHLRSLRLRFTNNSDMGRQQFVETPKMLLDLMTATNLKELIVCHPHIAFRSNVEPSIVCQSISAFIERSGCALTHFSVQYHSNHLVEAPALLFPSYPHDSPFIWQTLTRLSINYAPSWMVIEQLPYVPNLEYLHAHLLTLKSEEAGVRNPVVQLANRHVLLPKLRVLILRAISNVIGVTRLCDVLSAITAPALSTFGMSAMKGEWPVRETLEFLDRSQCQIDAIDVNVPPRSFLQVLRHPGISSSLKRLIMAPACDEVENYDGRQWYNTGHANRRPKPYRRHPHISLFEFLEMSSNLPRLSELILGVIPVELKLRVRNVLLKRRPEYALRRSVVCVELEEGSRPTREISYGDRFVMGHSHQDIDWGKHHMDCLESLNEDDWDDEYCAPHWPSSDSTTPYPCPLVFLLKEASWSNAVVAHQKASAFTP